jgi:hypothetical protein
VSAPAASDDFLSGESGSVAGPRLRVTRAITDAAHSIGSLVTLTGPRLDRLAAEQPPRRVLVLGLYRPGSRMPRVLGRLRSERHDVRTALGAIAQEADHALEPDTKLTGLTGGKFENLNLLLESAEPQGADWIVVADDDVDLPRHFLDRFVAVCERLEFDLAQPAQTARSHAAWRVTRRRPLSLARRTSYVEIGPVTAFSARAAGGLLPFPQLRFGWGLDNHWSAVARERGWGLGVVDALPVRHEWQPVAASYGHDEAIAEARRFLAERPYVPANEAQRTLSTIRRLPS